MAAASTVVSVVWGSEDAMCGGGTMMRCGCVGKGSACGGGSGIVVGSVGGALFEAGRSEVVEPRRAEREGGDVRSGGGVKETDAVNPLQAAKRWSGRGGVVPARIAVWLRVRLVVGNRVLLSSV